MVPVSPAPQVVILLATCPRYRWIARLTKDQIDVHWSDHPPIFFCGLPPDPGWNHLFLVNEVTDWLGILAAAVRDLIARGFTQVYLILDDHLPLGRCHQTFLNEVLPRQMVILAAQYIGLHGWGQGRPVNGQVLGREFFRLEHVSRDYLWKFQLHPALWNLFFLEQLATSLQEKLPVEDHHPWAFERRAGDPRLALPEGREPKAYRVCGARTTRNRWRLPVLASVLLAGKGFRFLAGKIGGAPAWKALDDRLTFLTRYYEGPYPLFWEGALRKGEPNRFFLRFLKFSGQRKTIDRFYAFREDQT